jgi:hypothetical protein
MKTALWPEMLSGYDVPVNPLKTTLKENMKEVMPAQLINQLDFFRAYF